MILFLTVTHGAMAADEATDRTHERFAEALERVDATPEQREAAERRLEASWDEWKALRERAEAVREEVHDALFGATVDRKALDAARRELLSVVDDGSELLFDLAADVSELLTAAQREELHALRHERIRERIGAWWHGTGD